MANLSPKDIDFVEVHDCFTIAELIDIEDLGFFPKGAAAQAVREGRTRLNSDITVNPSGGLKSKGHPIGATGVGQVVEVFEQFTNKAGRGPVNTSCSRPCKQATNIRNRRDDDQLHETESPNRRRT
jgi:acetyl-CoA C-acetyltransferase